MSNQIETQIDVSLTERNRVTALFRIILAVPALIFVSSLRLPPHFPMML
jgi:hypothetical protein